MSNIFNFLAALTPEEKLAAIEFLWCNLAVEVDQFPSPDWHGDVIRDRLENPSSEPALPIEEAMLRIKERAGARSNPS